MERGEFSKGDGRIGMDKGGSLLMSGLSTTTIK